MMKLAVLVTMACLLTALAAPARAQCVEGCAPAIPANDTADPPGSQRLLTVRDGRAYWGGGQVPIPGADFYRAVDRPDLAARYDRRLGFKYVGGAAGLAMLAGGLVWGGIDLLQTSWPLGPGRRASPYPWVTAGAGLGLMVAAIAFPADPASEAERIGLARAHNRKVTLLPRIEPGSAGLTLAARF